MIIEIKGVQFVNKGAELMLHAVLEQINTRWPDADIALDPKPTSPYQKRAKLGAWQKLSIRKSVLDLNFLVYWLPHQSRRWLKERWGIVTEADIDLVLDASGFAYGDQWNVRASKHLAGEVKRYKKHGKAYVFLPQAFGPFTREADRDALAQSFQLADFVASREIKSHEYVKNLTGGTSSNLFMFPDFTNLVKGRVPSYYTDGDKKILIIPNSRMLSGKNNNTAWQTHYVKILTDAVEVIEKLGYEPVVLNHEGEEDLQICTMIATANGRQLRVIEEADALAVKGIIGASKGIICSRFHGCVSALTQGIPCLGTSWSHKYEQLFNEYGKGEFLINANCDKAILQQQLSKAMDAVNQPDYLQAIQSFKEKTTTMWDTIEQRLLARHA